MVSSKKSVQRLVCLLVFSCLCCRAFVPSSCRRHVLSSSRQFFPTDYCRINTTFRKRRVSSMVMTAEDTASSFIDEQYDNIHDLNLELDRLAEQCSNNPNNADSVVACAAQCEDLYNQGLVSNNLQPDIVSFNTVLKAWSKACVTMVDHHQKFSPNKTTLSVAVYTPRDAAERATKLLVEMEEQLENNNNDGNTIVPDTTSYNAAIDAWAKSRAPDAPQAAERLLQRLINNERIEPDTLSYNGVLTAWAFSNAPNAMDRVHKIYNHMQKLHEDGNNSVKPTIRTVNAMINAHAKRVSLYYKINDPSGALEEAVAAHDLLKEMNQKYQETGDVEYQPDVTTYTTVMDAYGRCGQLEATLEAEALLQELKDANAKGGTTHYKNLQPNFRTYTALISAWSKTRHADSPKRAEEVLNEMQQLFKQRLESGVPLLDGEDTTKPNSRTYTGVIQCWGRSRDKTKAQRVLKILQTMRREYKENGNLDAKPNLISYNAAIDACARCPGDAVQQTEALKIAFAMLKSIELEPDLIPNQVTYSTLLKAAASLLPLGPERNAVATAVFEKAVKAGMVETSALRNLRTAVDNQVIRELLKDLEDSRGNIDYEKMPSAWSRNVS